MIGSTVPLLAGVAGFACLQDKLRFVLFVMDTQAEKGGNMQKRAVICPLPQLVMRLQVTCYQNNGIESFVGVIINGIGEKISRVGRGQTGMTRSVLDEKGIVGCVRMLVVWSHNRLVQDI